MRIRIIAPYKGATTSGIYGADGKEIPIGHELTVDKAPEGWAGRYIDVDADTASNDDEIDALKARIAELEGENATLKAAAPIEGQPLNKTEITSDGENPRPGAEDGPSDVPVTTDQGGHGATTYEARDTGSGWWTIFDNTGAEAGKKLRKDDAKAFNALSDAEKAEYLKTV
jgi:hypothetical protein